MVRLIHMAEPTSQQPGEAPEYTPDSQKAPPSLIHSSWPGPGPVTQPLSLMSELRGLVRTVRPHQWVKNVFVLAPVVFATKLFDPVLIWNAGVAFCTFCMLAGAVYTMNDLADVEADRLHPVKRFRPIASGRVREPVAKGFALLLVLGSLALAFATSLWFGVVAAGYFVLNIAYTFRLKEMAYIDVSCIALGFVLRVLGGGFATRIEVSWYLLACTALLALFLGLGKRRHELTTAEARPSKQRQALEAYTKRGLDVALWVTAAATVAVYLVYTLDPSTLSFFRAGTLWPTSLFVVAGVWRFVHIVRYRPKAESPTQEMISDGPMVGIVLLWIMVIGWLVYHLHPS